MKINATKIRALYTQKGFTQEQFAKKAGLSTQGFNAILGRESCSMGSLLKIANALEVLFEELMYGK
ncbi:MAG: helix-turn-helix domain-containing protein [Saccharofermentanales bacterium]|jgi:transcriptional regulator with XRE-family HTH domain|nr:helix-turn-helix transcriptional regulator [Candidatus Epulonipiscium sp.]